jgi:hypothetical protein
VNRIKIFKCQQITDYISSYASTHPWKDFAETWAHYLHIVDTIEMAQPAAFRARAGDERHHILISLPGVLGRSEYQPNDGKTPLPG